MSNISQPLALELAQAVNTAYTAYNQITWLKNNAAGAIALIKQLQPGYTNIAPIFVWESNPEDPGYPTWGGASTHASTTPLESQEPPEDSALYWPGSQLFGFAATIPAMGINILILRGTVTNYEAGASLWNWDNTSALAVPTPNGFSTGMARVKAGFWDFYSGEGAAGEPSLASGLKRAIAAVDALSPLPWLAASHSLGGAMLCLGVVDALADKTFSTPPAVVTFGSVVVGNAAWAELYDSHVLTSVRVVNLCDFVPSLRSLLPGKDTVNYQHVGNTWAFVWQTDSDWDNHSMENIYQRIVASQRASTLIYKEPNANVQLVYPVGIVPQNSGAA